MDKKNITNAANQGDMNAQYELGKKHDKFLASDADKEKARRWYKTLKKRRIFYEQHKQS